MMASLQGLPPLPKSLSGLLNFSSAQWKEMERLHAMRTIIQQDLSRASLQRTPSGSGTEEVGSPSSSGDQSRSGRLDIQLALLRKEMVGLRQLDMSLLCQLWSLNESIHEYKQLLQDRMSLSLSPSHASSLGWDNGMDSPSSEEHNGTQEDNDSVPQHHKRGSVDSASSLEFGDI